MIKKSDRNQLKILRMNRDRVLKAFEKTELEVFKEEGRWFITPSDIKRHTSLDKGPEKLSWTTIFRHLKDLRTEQKKIQKVGSRGYASARGQFLKKMVTRFFIRSSFEEIVTGTYPVVLFDEWLSLLSGPYSEIKEEISQLQKSKVRTILRIRKLMQLHNEKTRIEQGEKEKFSRLKNLVVDATTISFLSGHSIYPYSEFLPFRTPLVDEKNSRIGIDIEELKRAVWRMLMLFVAHPNFSLENSGLSIVINFDPREIVKTDQDQEEFRKYLANLDHSGWRKHLLKPGKERLS